MCHPVCPGPNWRGGWDEGDTRAFRAYTDRFDSIPHKTVDMVLVDGRSRVECAKRALSKLHEESIVLLHDSQRSYYKPIWDYYDEVETASTLTIFRPKPEYVGKYLQPGSTPGLASRKKTSN